METQKRNVETRSFSFNKRRQNNGSILHINLRQDETIQIYDDKIHNHEYTTLIQSVTTKSDVTLAKSNQYTYNLHISGNRKL